MTTLRHAFALSLAVGLVACGNPSPGSTGPTPPIDAGRSANAPEKLRDAGAAAAPVDTPTDAGPSGVSPAECNRFIDHAISISLGAHNDNTPPELRPTGEQLAAIRTQLRGELAAACAKLPKSGFLCAMAAKTKDAFLRCGSPGTPEDPAPTGNPARPGQSSPRK